MTAQTMSRDIQVSHIDRDPAQPRKHFDEGPLRELADSMESTGLIQPIIIRPGFYHTVHEQKIGRHAFPNNAGIRLLIGGFGDVLQQQSGCADGQFFYRSHTGWSKQPEGKAV